MNIPVIVGRNEDDYALFLSKQASRYEFRKGRYVFHGIFREDQHEEDQHGSAHPAAAVPGDGASVDATYVYP